MALANGSRRLAQSLLRPLGSAQAPLGAFSLQQRGIAEPAAAEDTSLTVEVRPFAAHRIEPPSTTVTTDRAELLKFFTSMYRMRRMEIAADMLYKAKFIRGFCHLYDGQEAILEGIEAALEYTDSIITSYRDHCTHLGRGGTVVEVMAELMGRVDGAAKGMGGSMHMYKKEHNFYGGQGIVGAQIPVGAGLAFAHKYREDGGVALTMYGDGAANQGQKYEALNIAALWDLPCIFIIENNHYGMGTAEWRGSKSSSFYTRGDYTPGLKVDGMDVLAVKQAMTFAKDYATKNGPILMEMDTYRYHGHSMSDPGSTYRTRDEISMIRQSRDPLEHVRKLLTDNNLASTSELKAIEKDVKKEIDAAVDKAKNSPIPPDDALWKNIYKDTLGSKMKGLDSAVKIQL